ncbi:MAG: ExbD/TolR family protein [bacterium]|nr:ExbD/TolR family protein [bacterium]
MADSPLKARRSLVGTTLSEINVTPMVDVFLVLLIIFMVTAPLLQHGIDVQLPRQKSKALRVEKPIVVTVTKKRRMYLNRQRVSLEGLERQLRLVARARPGETVFLRADREVAYGAVVEAMAAVRRAGIERLGMVTQPVD